MCHTVPGGFSLGHKDITPQLRKAKRLVLSGLSGERLAKALGVATRTAHGYVKRLVLMGELIDITGDPHSTPRIYDDAKKRVQFSHPSSTLESGVKKTVGVGTTPDCASLEDDTKVLRFHCTGCYDVVINTLGEHTGRIADNQGFTVGGWSDITSCNGSLRQYGRLRLPEGDDLKFILYLAKAGPKLTIYPQPRDVYYKTANNEGPRALWSQVYSLLNILTENHGWTFGQVIYKGTNHGAMLTGAIDPLLKYMDLSKDSPQARYHIDTSKGTPELEVYYDSPTAQEDANLIFELPDRLNNLELSMSRAYRVLDTLRDGVDKLTVLTAKLIEAQANIANFLTKSLENNNTTYQVPPYDGRGYN